MQYCKCPAQDLEEQAPQNSKSNFRQIISPRVEVLLIYVGCGNMSISSLYYKRRNISSYSLGISCATRIDIKNPKI